MVLRLIASAVMRLTNNLSRCARDHTPWLSAHFARFFLGATSACGKWRRKRSQHEPAGVDRVHAEHADRRVLGGVGVRVEEDVGIGRGGEVIDLAGSREGCGADECEGLIAADREVGIDRIEGEQVTAGAVEVGHHVRFGKRIQAINGENMTLGSTLGLTHMALAVLGQLRDVLDSLIQRDVKMAVDVWARDEDVDRLCAQLSRELVGRMAQDPDAVMLGIQLLFCTKNLERVGDHATNIAEAIYYIVEGRRLLGERPKADVTSIVTK
jgi:phosphate transport system protein